MASVSATLFMTLMQLAGYLAPFAYIPAFALWSAAVVAHLALMGWFTARFISHFKLHEVFPTYFICYVGIVVASVTSPVFGMQALGQAIFWFGFACYAALLVLVTYRYAKHEVPEGARPLFCIYTAPMSLSLVGYLATAPQPNLVFVLAMLVLAQALFAWCCRAPRSAAPSVLPQLRGHDVPLRHHGHGLSARRSRSSRLTALRYPKC